MRGILKRLTSDATRRSLAFRLVRARIPTARWRPLPNVLVVGAQRCGTSSLFKYLGAHPECGASVRKEARFFTEYYDEGVDWYRAHFTLRAGRPRRKVHFEATPDYLLDPRVPRRAKALLPEDLRIIALLRDPVERAYSHYWHNRRLGTERIPFEEALAREPERIDAHLRQLEEGFEGPAHKSILRYSYVERGRYSKHLDRWLQVIEKDRVLVLGSERFYKETDAVYRQILGFLGLKSWRPESYKNFSYTAERPKIPAMSAEARGWLESELALEIEQVKRIQDTVSAVA